MRNDWYYRIGRELNTGGRGVAYRGRVQRALKKHTRFGKRVERISWSSNEFSLLTKLHELGADVPKPLASSENAILMEYLGDGCARHRRCTWLNWTRRNRKACSIA